MLSIYLISRFTRLFESTGTGETKSLQNDKEASNSNLYSVLQLEASSPIENNIHFESCLRLSVLECKHAESTNNCREKQRLLSTGRDAEEILNSYTNSKYKLLNGSRTTWQYIVWTFIVRRQAAQTQRHRRFTHHASESVLGRNESKLSWINRTTLNPLWMSETFTPRCSFWTTRRFWILLRTKISHKLSAGEGFHRYLVWGVASNTSWTSKVREGTGTRDILTIRRHFFDRHSCIRVQSSSVNRQASFIFIASDWRATISESYITYLHFDDKVSTALARSRHKNPSACMWRCFGGCSGRFPALSKIAIFETMGAQAFCPKSANFGAHTDHTQ